MLIPLITVRLRIIVFAIIGVLFFQHSHTSLSHARDRPLIAAVLSSSAPPFYRSLDGFRQTLTDRGIDYDYFEFIAGNDSDNEKFISSLRSLKPNLIYTAGTKSSLIVKNEFSDLPVVFSMALNPVASGLVESMSSSSNNLTGASMDVPFRTQFEQLKRIIPRLNRVGVMFSRSQTESVVSSAERVATSMGIKLVKEEVKTQEDVPEALRRLEGRIDILWSVADGIVFNKLTTREILLFSLRKKIPFAGLSSAFVEAGALVAFEVDHTDIGRQAAETAIRVMGGEKPSGIPITVPRKIRVFMNSNTIRLLKIKLPKDVRSSIEMIYP